jgi:hypothetical protein
MVKLVCIIRARDDVPARNFTATGASGTRLRCGRSLRLCGATWYDQSHPPKTSLNKAMAVSRGMVALYEGITE